MDAVCGRGGDGTAFPAGIRGPDARSDLGGVLRLAGEVGMDEYRRAVLEELRAFADSKAADYTYACYAPQSRAGLPGVESGHANDLRIAWIDACEELRHEIEALCDRPQIAIRDSGGVVVDLG